jgi:uncharacterized protein DUF1236
MQEELMIDYRHAAMAAALLATAGAADAQTTVITREPVETRTVVTTGPVELTPVQRQTVVRTIARERVNPAAPTVVYEVGTRVPNTVELYPVPESLAVEVPAVRPYRYMVVNGRVVLVDPATSQVVADISE